MVRETNTMSNSFDKSKTTKKKSIWDSLQKLRAQVQEVFAGDHLDTARLMELEEILILSDTGPKVAAEITKNISERMKNAKKSNGGEKSTVILKCFTLGTRATEAPSYTLCLYRQRTKRAAGP